MNRGVCLIASGSPRYGEMAATLAQSLKHLTPDLHITLCWSGASKNNIHQFIGTLFDDEIEIPKEFITRNTFECNIKAKTHLYELSPYDKTIFFDVDTIFFPFKPISNLFDEMDGIKLTMGNRGLVDLSTDPRLIWAKTKDMIDKFGNISVYNLSSEFIYFERSDEVEMFFLLAQDAFNNPGVEYTRFDGGVPDELAFQIAFIKTNLKPHKSPYLPFYWEPFQKQRLTLPQLYKTDFYGYSIGGAVLDLHVKEKYDALVRFYGNAFGIKFIFPARNKKEWSYKRTNI